MVEHKSAEELMIIYQQKSPVLALLAFHELYRRYSERVFSFLLKKCQNKSDAEDLLQKVFIKVHESKHLYKSDYKFEQWLFVIARTSALDFWRKEQRYQNKLNQWSVELPSVPNEKEDVDYLAALSSDQREMLELKYIDQLTYQEMSRLFNKSEVSLRKMLSRVVLNLKKGEA